jgi:hypothetical protein
MAWGGTGVAVGGTGVAVGGIGVEVGGTAVGTGGSVGDNGTATVGLRVGVAVGLEPHALMVITNNIRTTA